MAIVLRHIHFCPKCNEFWTCICWACSSDLDDRECTQCRSNKTDPSKPHLSERNIRGVKKQDIRLHLAEILDRCRYLIIRKR